jgi:hypothetical protein
MVSRKGVKLSKALARIDALTLRRIAEGKYKPKASRPERPRAPR